MRNTFFATFIVAFLLSFGAVAGVSFPPSPSDSYNASGTGANKVPLGTTGQRPSVPVNGMIRDNSTLHKFEAYVNGSWETFISSVSGLVDLGSQVFGTLSEPNGGTANSTPLTAGSIIFKGASSYTQDNANLFWDDANNRLGIGTTSPATALDVVGTLKASGAVTFSGLTTAGYATVGTTGVLGSAATIPTGDITVDDDRAVTGVSDTLLSTDGGKTVVYKSQATATITLPSSSTEGFGSGYGTQVSVRGAEGANLSSTSLIDDNYGLFIKQGDDCSIRSSGSKYSTFSCPVLSYNPTFSTNALFFDSRISAVNATAGTCSYVNESGVIAYTAAGQCAGRVEYDPSTLVLKGGAVEPEITNSLSYSNDMTNSYWVANGVVKSTASDIVAPDGSTGSVLLVTSNTATAAHGITRTNAAADCTIDNTLSVYVLNKVGNTHPYLRVQLSGGADNLIARFNLETKTLTSTAAGSGTIYSALTEEYNSDWTRYSLSGKSSSAGTCFVNIEFLATDGGGESFKGAATDQMYMWGAQLENNKFPTSLVPTTTTFRKREADVVSVPSPYWLKNSTGTMCFDFYARTNTASAVILGDSTADLSLLSYATDTSAGSNDGTNANDYSINFASAGSINKACVRYGGIVSNVSVNGTLGTQGTFDGNFGVTGINVFRDYDSANKIYGNIKRLRWFSYMLTDAEMVTETTP